MTLRHMKIFVSVCEFKSMTKAANHLYMTQPSISQAIKELEEFYGITLFERLNRTLYLTSAGDTLYQYAFHIVTLFEDAERCLKNSDSLGILKIGANITIGTTLIADYIHQFHELYPDITVNVTIQNSVTIEQMIYNNELDFALVEELHRNTYLKTKIFCSDRIVIAASPEHPLASKDTLSLSDILKEPLLVREKGSGVRDLFEQIVLSEGYSLNPQWESCSSEALINAASNKLGLAILSYRMISQNLHKKELIELHVENLNLHRNLMVVYHNNKLLSKAARSFIEICINSGLSHIIN
ncbi:LysR family transcriptional regulator [Anaeromicropila populeti]|uniref:DNA-binding transcriptional regulator, LysR family n=1 Tax=Anaeromicropila populeti TaxID=37658 RepID=A0A1I6J2K9_9FIRM|nr:LysR family transcriptional regulator [Anaeromicropila populeti]SFR72740.1 DNA-binding transcriptional regulator, LysR family [Anaeromicropila populeti]